MAMGGTGPVDLVVQLVSERLRDQFVFLITFTKLGNFQIVGLDKRPSSVFMQEFLPSISWEMHVFLNPEKKESKGKMKKF